MGGVQYEREEREPILDFRTMERYSHRTLLLAFSAPPDRCPANTVPAIFSGPFSPPALINPSMHISTRASFGA
jgi:hypothetical protein